MATNISERYDFTRGMALIFNNVKFEEEEEREGSDNDLANIVKAFESMGFDEGDIQRERNSTTVDIKSIVKNCMESARDAKPDCFVCVILSHGWGPPDYVCGTDGVIPLRNLMDPVQNCQALDGKPKIFIVQACRGDRVSQPVVVEEPVQPPKPDAGSTPSDISEAGPSSIAAEGMEPRHEHAYDITVGEDCLLYYATQPGFVSFEEETYTPFVQHFCKQVEDNKDTEFDFLSLLTRVNHDVAVKYESYVPDEKGLPRGLHGKKQMP